MPNSEIEVILPADGRGETRNFLWVCVAIIALALGLLSLIQKTSHQVVPELPTALSNTAIQISNAVEEITLLEESELISAPYQLSELPLPSLNGTQFTQLDERCFTLFQGQYAFVVERHEERWDAHWTATEHPVDCHDPVNWHSLNQ